MDYANIHTITMDYCDVLDWYHYKKGLPGCTGLVPLAEWIIAMLWISTTSRMDYQVVLF